MLPLTKTLAAFVTLLLLFGTQAVAETDATLVESGRRIYESGILPDNSLLVGQRPEGFTLAGKQAACSNCHRRSGMGSIEGLNKRIVLVPPIAAPVLFNPARFATSYLDTLHHFVPTKSWERAMTRPAYDDASLARALRASLDPDGKRLLPPMMRYDLDDNTMAALTAYLHTLGNQPSPGVTQHRLHIATIVTPDVNREQADAVVEVIEVWIRAIRPFNKRVQLHVWRLKGEESDWMSELKRFYHQQPVFAVLSGAGGARWQAIEQFCEHHAVPCILPSVEVTPEDNLSDTRLQPYYSLYYSSGVTLEARLLATYLQQQSTHTSNRLIQIYGDNSGKLAAHQLRQFTAFSKDARWDRRLRLTSPTSAIAGVRAKDRLMLWLRPDEIQLLTHIWKTPPVNRIYISALLAPPGSVSLPLAWRRHVAYVSLFDDMGVQGEIAKVRLKRWLAQHKLPEVNLRMQADAYSACYLFNAALSRIRKQEIRRPAVPLSRHQLLEMLETLVDKYSDGTEQIDPDSHVAFYGRMSLGPEQRFAVRGGNIQRFRAPDYNRLTAASGRIVPR